MRTGLILFFILWIPLGAYAMNQKKFPHSEHEISEWATELYGFYRPVYLSIEDKKLLIVIGDTAFGTSRLVLHVFVYERNEWELLFTRYTNTSDIKIEVDENTKQLVFRSKAGKILLSQPFDSLNLKFDRSEQ
jgi:hypothetical protein